jgi:hypothetical protein
MNNLTLFFPGKTALYALLLLAACGLSSCKDLDIGKVADPAALALQGSSDCRLILVGQVLDARTLAPVPQTAVQLFDQGTISDQEGMYRLEVPAVFDPVDIERLLWTAKPGYELLSYQFAPAPWVEEDDCAGTISYICLDLVLTRRKPAIIIQPNAPTNLVIRDTTLFRRAGFDGQDGIDTLISVLELNIPAGAVDLPTAIHLSPIARASYLGALPEQAGRRLPLFRFRLASDPMVELKQPFTVRFEANHPLPLDPEDPLRVLRTNDLDRPFQGFDLPSNRWRQVQDAQVGYHQPSQRVQVRSHRMGTYMVWNDRYALDMKDAFATQGPEESLINLANCNCGEANWLSYTFPIEGRLQHGLDQSGGFSALERLIWLNDLKVLTNTPFASLTALQKLAGANAYNVFIPGPDKELQDQVLLGKCRQLYVTYRTIGHNASGNQYGLAYQWQRAAGTRVRINPVLCPVTSSCHQGCP